MTPGVPGAPEPRMYPRSRYYYINYIMRDSAILYKIHTKNMSMILTHGMNKKAVPRAAADYVQQLKIYQNQ